MASALDKGPKESPLLVFALKHVNILCTLSYILGVIGFFALAYRDVSPPVYMDENALLTGLQDPLFNMNEVHLVHQYNNRLIKEFEHGEKGMLQESLLQILQESSMYAHKQDFTSISPLPNVIEGKRIHKAQNHSNVYGIMRAGRASSTEALVLNVPLPDDRFNYGVGVALAFGSFVRAQPHWAKDVILLFTEDGYAGAQAWLESYHDSYNSEFIKASPLEERAGDIQAALVLNLQGEVVNYFNIEVVGSNGLLPNQDMFNVVAKLCRNERARIGLHKEFSMKNHYSWSYDEYITSLRTMIKMMSQQAKGFSPSNHAVFLQHNVQSLALEGVKTEKRGGIGYEKVGRIVEGTFRSMNNLLETLHHSFFFYLLPSTDRYVSIGFYMPPLGLIVLVPTLKALCLYAIMMRSEKKKEDKSTDDNVKELLNEEKSTEGNTEQVISLWSDICWVFAIAYFAGACLFFSPKFAPTWSSMFDLDDRKSLLLVFISTYIFGALMPIASIKRVFQDHKVIETMRIMALVVLAGTLGCVAVLNFSLGMVLAVVCVPLLTPVSGRYKIVHLLLALIASPAIIALLLAACDEAFVGRSVDVFSAAENILRNLYEQSLTGNNWIFSFACLLFYPNWLLFWFLSLSRSEFE